MFSIWQGLGCLSTASLFWAPDLHLWRMFLNFINIFCYTVYLNSCKFYFLDLEIICPNDTNVYSNHSDTVKNFSWSKPKVINRKNGTNFSVEVEPSWAVPPVDFNTTGSTVITYFARHKYGQTINCSFTITVLNETCEFGCWCIILFIFHLQ